MITFKATGIVHFTRTEVKYRRSWWQEIVKWWNNEIDIPMYRYEVEMHTDCMEVRHSDIVMTEFEMPFFVAQLLPTVKIKSLAPTDKWLIFTDFKEANYVVTSRGFREGDY